MNTNSEENVLPRPVEALPEYANARARQNLTERLRDAFHLAPEAATAIANAVVDPSGVRKSVGEVIDPGVEEFAVPGGTLLGIRTYVWTRRIMPDPRNPRILPARRHPFAVDPGTAGEDSKFRPIADPKPLDPEHPELAELMVEIENRHQLTWASEQAAKYVLADNDWRSSIASQGVMEAVWLVSTTYKHTDGTDPVTVLTTVEGSSRTTAAQTLLKVRSADVPYDDQEAKFRAWLRKLNERLEDGQVTAEEQIFLRCERMPAVILVGFRKHATSKTGFATAIKSMVALRHVDPPKPWGAGPENEALADEVLDELYRQDLISAIKRDYFAGSCTRAEAAAAHLSPDPAVRAAHIANLFIAGDAQIKQAIRVAVTSQSTRKQITQKLANELATALILRALADDRAKTDQVRRYLKHAFGKAVHRDAWEATDRSINQLTQDAMLEVYEAIAGPPGLEPGAASLELAVRAAYPLIVSGRLNADLGTMGGQPDRRTPGEVLEAMRQTPQGIFQLSQALNDYAEGRNIRAVDENGGIKSKADGAGEEVINDVMLRSEFPPAGKAKAARPGDTPTDQLNNRISELSRVMDQLGTAFRAVQSVVGHDGLPVVDTSGVDRKLCAFWRQELTTIDEELMMWGRTFQRLYSSDVPPNTLSPLNDGESGEPEDVYADSEELDAVVEQA